MYKHLKNIIRRLRGYMRKLLIFILKICMVCVFKVIGPPRVLQYGSPVNIALLKAFGAKVGQNVIACSPIVLNNARDGYRNLTIQDNCNFNGNNFLDLCGKITLEKGVSLGPGVIIMTHNRYNHNKFLEDRLAHTCGVKDVLIKEGSGIKAGALIVHGITIGKNAVVAGNAVVNRDVGDNCFVAGVPAHLVKEII
jgi:acetyltransferase-like isoleucine patch superfamily enzyme